MNKSIFFIIALTLSGCSSYNTHVDECSGEKTGSIKRVLSYTPIGALFINSKCAIAGPKKITPSENPKQVDSDSTPTTTSQV
ncbi:TPA: hypothetical protein OOF39_000053 [Kluyvera ascorbata]|nr:hypothetical protein [Kluyvera ascorbata]